MRLVELNDPLPGPYQCAFKVHPMFSNRLGGKLCQVLQTAPKMLQLRLWVLRIYIASNMKRKKAKVRLRKRRQNMALQNLRVDGFLR